MTVTVHRFQRRDRVLDDGFSELEISTNINEQVGIYFLEPESERPNYLSFVPVLDELLEFHVDGNKFKLVHDRVELVAGVTDDLYISVQERGNKLSYYQDLNFQQSSSTRGSISR